MHILMAQSSIGKIRKTVDEVQQRDLEDRRNGWILTKNHGLHPILLILANVLIYYFVNIRHGYPIHEASNDLLIKFGADFGPLTAKQPWRLLTAMFLHADVFHLLGNMGALFFSGRLVHHFYGTKRFYLIYLVGGLFGGLVSPFFHPLNVCIGASGAVFAVDGAMIAAIVQRWTRSRLPLSSFAILLIGYGIFESLVRGFSGQHINNAVHVGSIVAGLALGFWIHKTKLRFTIVRNATLALLMMAFVGVYFGIYANLKLPPAPQQNAAVPKDLHQLMYVMLKYATHSGQIQRLKENEYTKPGQSVEDSIFYQRLTQLDKTTIKELSGLRMSDRESYNFQKLLYDALDFRIRIAQQSDNKISKEDLIKLGAVKTELGKLVTYFRAKYGQPELEKIVASVPPFEVIGPHESERRLALTLMIFDDALGNLGDRMLGKSVKTEDRKKSLFMELDSLCDRTLATIALFKMSDPESGKKLATIHHRLVLMRDAHKKVAQPNHSSIDLQDFLASLHNLSLELKNYQDWYVSRYGRGEFTALKAQAAANPWRFVVNDQITTPSAQQTRPVREAASSPIPSPAASESCRNSLSRFRRVPKSMLQNCAYANSYSAAALDSYTQIYTRGLSGRMQETLLKVSNKSQLECVVRAAHRFSARMTTRYLEDNCL